MRNRIPEPLRILAKACPSPLYLVGGSVRDYVLGSKSSFRDYDICAPLSADELINVASKLGFSVKSVFRNTGTVKMQDSNGTEYEYSSFRSDKYVRGVHVPVETYFTNDINLDAKRRDFTCNAVYYDIQKDAFVDPLDGITAIHDKRLTTVAPAYKVFGEDGLRLMRLARQAAHLGFSPDSECLLGAKQNAYLIKDISPERIFTELQSILRAEERYGNKDGAYQGLRLLEEIGVFAYIFPELQLGKNMTQRKDFHDYDVLEHSLRAVKYADSSIRLAALLHDIGKPFCQNRDGNVHEHHKEGAILAQQVLTRLKAPNHLIKRIPALIEWHMYDMDCKTSEHKLRRFFVTHYTILDELILLKQADFSACKDDTSIAPTCQKWKTLLSKMKAENAPFTLKQLAISGKDVLGLGIKPNHVSTILNELLLHAATTPADNNEQTLIKLALSFEKSLSSRR